MMEVKITHCTFCAEYLNTPEYIAYREYVRVDPLFEGIATSSDNEQEWQNFTQEVDRLWQRVLKIVEAHKAPCVMLHLSGGEEDVEIPVCRKCLRGFINDIDEFSDKELNDFLAKSENGQ